MIQTVYSVIILVATTIGALVGLGGGVIIKPLLDLIDHDPRAQVDFLSGCAVLTMSVVATLKAIKRKEIFDFNIIFFIASGSILGGYLGGYFVDTLSKINLSDSNVRTIQACILCILLILIIFYTIKPLKQFQIKSKIIIFFSGLLMGIIASFLGIGGGPFNVALLTLLFSFNAKQSAVYSIAIIFFSQLTNTLSSLISNGVSFYSHQWKTLIFILPSAVVGGLIGSYLIKKLKDKTIKNCFIVSTSVLVLVNILNIFKYT